MEQSAQKHLEYPQCVLYISNDSDFNIFFSPCYAFKVLNPPAGSLPALYICATRSKLITKSYWLINSVDALLVCALFSYGHFWETGWLNKIRVLVRFL